MTEHVHELWINVNHPCYGVDVWHSCEDEQLARGQGYLPLSEVRNSLNATERLSAENMLWRDAVAYDPITDTIHFDHSKIADILEGKDETE